jgi:N-acetylneuraminate synthase
MMEHATVVAHPAGRSTSCCVVAEVAQAHDGSLGTAHAFIDACARAGADAIKFQTHIAAAESTPGEPWRVKFSRQDASRYDYWKRMEFTEEQWHGLKQHADESGIQFLSSPFSVEAVDLLTRVGVAAWMLATGLPILLSSGMSPLHELDTAVAMVQRQGVPLTVLQCTSAYPCPPEKIGLNLLPFFRDRYSCPVGLSDHSGTIYAGLAAATLGATMLEVHVTFSREMFGPDVQASITLEELRQLVNGIRFIEAMTAHPIDKDAMAETMEPLRHLFTKSVVAHTDLLAGTVLRAEHLTVKKPGTGIPAARLSELLGRTLRCTVARDQCLEEAHLV